MDLRVGPKSSDWCVICRERDTETHKERKPGENGGRQKLELCCHKPRNTRCHQNLGQGKEGVFPGAFSGSMALTP